MPALPPTDLRRRAMARAALVTLHHARVAVRQHEADHRLRQGAVQQFVTRLHAAVAAGDLEFELAGRQARLAGEPLWDDPDAGGVVGALTAIGIGRVSFARAVTAGALTAFVELLADDHRAAGPDDDLATRWHACALEGIELGVAQIGDAEPESAGPSPWDPLPAPGPAAAALRIAAVHEQRANLPAIAARWLFVDLDSARPDAAALGPWLMALLDGMLTRGDAAGCAWLLEQAHQHPAVDPGVALALRGKAQAALSGPWLGAQLQDRPDDPTGLLALAMQLGDDAVRALVRAAEASGQTLPAWLLDLVPRG